jgi:hypothetical protein
VTRLSLIVFAAVRVAKEGGSIEDVVQAAKIAIARTNMLKYRHRPSAGCLRKAQRGDVVVFNYNLVTLSSVPAFATQILAPSKQIPEGSVPTL